LADTEKTLVAADYHRSGVFIGVARGRNHPLNWAQDLASLPGACSPARIPPGGYGKKFLQN
jgi:hypothetical protein